MIWLILSGLIATALFWYVFIKPINHFTKIGVKQTKPWPLVGDSWVTLFRVKSFGEFIIWIYNIYPKSRYIGFYQFARPTLMLRDPDLIKQITVKDFDHFTDHRSLGTSDVDKLWERNLFALKGLKWKEMRGTLSGSFTSSKMKHMFNVINEAAENFANYFMQQNQDHIELELKDTFAKYTNDVIASAAFGIKVDSLADPDNAFYNMGQTLTNFDGFFLRIKFMISVAVPSIKKLFKISIFSKTATEYFKNIIHETVAVREEKGIVRKDMINLLLEARRGVKSEEETVTETGFSTVQEYANTEKYKSKQLNLTNDDITSQALIFFVAGFATISTALSFGAYELALNKDVQKKLREEIITTHKANNGVLTYDSLLKMKYMDMVFSEILRKWPPAVGTDRVCTKPYTIQPVYPDEKPVHLKVGNMLMLPIFGLHRDPKYYPEPEKFNPDRFSDENKDSVKPYSYIPFGSGPRNCIGSRFAILEAKALLYHLLLNFEIVPTEKTSIPLKLEKKSFRHTCEGGFWLGLNRIKK